MENHQHVNVMKESSLWGNHLSYIWLSIHVYLPTPHFSWPFLLFISFYSISFYFLFSSFWGLGCFFSGELSLLPLFIVLVHDFVTCHIVPLIPLLLTTSLFLDPPTSTFCRGKPITPPWWGAVYPAHFPAYWVHASPYEQLGAAGSSSPKLDADLSH